MNVLGRTDLCERREFLLEAESRWSAPVMNRETWLEEVQLLFWIKKKKKKIREFFSAFIFVICINLRLSVLLAWRMWCVPACPFLSGGMTRRSASGDILVKV